MTDRSARRMHRLARWSLVQLTSVLVALVTQWNVAVLAAVIALVPIFLVWGHVQAELAINPLLDDRHRRRWRILLACLPGSTAVYWYRYVRPMRPAA